MKMSSQLSLFVLFIFLAGIAMMWFGAWFCSTHIWAIIPVVLTALILGIIFFIACSATNEAVKKEREGK